MFHDWDAPHPAVCLVICQAALCEYRAFAGIRYTGVDTGFEIGGGAWVKKSSSLLRRLLLTSKKRGRWILGGPRPLRPPIRQ